ncbi:MAG: hypothetical protein QF595_06335 [Dehalococcoidia bacterium]|jgi:hypothetical protein|nr:hypothetical protein [Dehalococcoidia bacterium]
MPWPPAFTHSKIAVTPGGYHATIRGSIRLVFPHQGKWLAFRGGPDAYHFSENGVTWTATEAPKPVAVTSLRGTSSTHFTLCLSNRSPNGFSTALSVGEPSAIRQHTLRGKKICGILMRRCTFSVLTGQHGANPCR